ncbi:RHS repeat-associated core domain-containing protein [Pseudomonas sp. MF7453]|uniref:RHS repeat-associated core domain-containing protein n=1 Tax=Pseudomonas sp. MF7453 TaxID=2797539 RepID=UPI0018E831E2|nr:RHS repeat-associated core domain-containing protein [Pseudomonas sp. MF7453]MBJ2220411.1 RHS repeat-associated core domain-containing protein [Pseudomonas sp. MF7453]
MSSLHHNTPSLTVFDPRGLTVRSVAYHRNTPQQPPRAFVTRHVFNAQGFLQQQWDPRLFDLHGADPAVLPNLSHRHSLTGQSLSSQSVDAGNQVRLLGSAGQVVQQWDSRGARQRFEYDPLLRPVAVFERALDEAAERCVERMSYAGMTSLEAARNRCGRLIRHDDPAGTLFFEHYDVQGGVTMQIRRLRAHYSAPDWPLAVNERDAQLQAEAFTTTWRHDVLGQVLEQGDARGNRQHCRYGVDGLLTHSEIVFKSGARKSLVDQRTFNAAAQLLTEHAGNGVVSVAEYSDTDGRLTRLSAHLKAKPDTPLQDLSYRYDRVGNVVRIHDAAQPTRWSSNVQVDAVSTFEYDSLSRLIKATGRENARNTGSSALPGRVTFAATDDNLWRNYTRHYAYDPAGNLTQMRHVPSSGSGFTQHMRVGEQSNHSVIEAQGLTAPGLGNGFDQAGNLQALAAGQALTWNVRNQLVRVAQVVRDNGEHDDEVYLYDGAGQRVIKRRVIHARAQAHSHEVLYLPGLELHRHGTSGEWLDVLIAQAGRNAVRGLCWQQGRPEGIVDEQLRFSLCDHSGSSTLELDEHAGLLSQESYYPFGATAWWAAKNAVEASYKSVRYSGKERDATGLYYYGFRYYAPWLLRWVSADPAGDVDGLNLYAMVGNNPIGYVDDDGLQRSPLVGIVGIIILMALAAQAMGLDAVQSAQLVIGGMTAVVVGITLLVRQHVRADRDWEEERRATYRKLALKGARELLQGGRATEDEVAALEEFLYQFRVNQSDTANFSYGLTVDKHGGLYAYVGPGEGMDKASEAAKTHGNPAPELRRLGFEGMRIRAPLREAGVGPLPAGLTHTEVQPLTRAAGTRRTSSATEATIAEPASPEPSSGLAPELAIDETSILNELRGPGGGIIRTVINRLKDRTLDFHTGHAMRGGQNIRSFDLPGYRGQRGRGAYRLLVQHVSGLNYRAVRVMNPHRR